MPESNKKRKHEDDLQDIKRLLEQRKKAKTEHGVATEITSELTPHQKNKAKSNKKGPIKKAVNKIDNLQSTLSQVQKELHEKAVPIVQDMMRIKLSEQETVKVFEEALKRALQDLSRRSPDTRINVDNLTASIQSQLIQAYGKANQHAWIVTLASSLAVHLLGEMPYVGTALRVGGNATAFVTTANELYKFYQKSEKTYTDYIKTLLTSVGGAIAVADSYNLMRSVSNSTSTTSSLLVSSSSKAKKVAARCAGLTGADERKCLTQYSNELLNKISKKKQ